MEISILRPAIYYLCHTFQRDESPVFHYLYRETYYDLCTMQAEKKDSIQDKYKITLCISLTSVTTVAFTEKFTRIDQLQQQQHQQNQPTTILHVTCS